MFAKDLILDANHVPLYKEIFNYINEPARELWQDINSYIQQEYRVTPKITYSKCSAKPGWNVKYQKSGKSLCTLYPEQDGFVVLVVILLDLVPIIEARSGEFDTKIIELMRTAKPFNGTIWLMIQVHNSVILNNIKQLLLLKHEKRKSARV